ncbi:hypothetical protein R5R35_003301 [Gryllus longicercus]|uniref:Cytochrome b5 heme-binding domain-containing protein n=1 Tax=Gryllus longicercus TaxID=2509291 RepID=A0AAN9VF92_9ORTH
MKYLLHWLQNSHYKLVGITVHKNKRNQLCVENAQCTGVIKKILPVVIDVLFVDNGEDLNLKVVGNELSDRDNNVQSIQESRIPPEDVSDKSTSKQTLFTEETLKKYINKKTGLYLAILGEVYDVTKGEKHYGPGGSYHFFTGRDASRAFVTGDFSEHGLNDDVLDLEPQDIKSLFKWVSVYKKQYKFKGKLIGRYYDSQGNPTGYRYKVENKLKLAEGDEIAKNKEKLRMPPCNTEWNVDQGSRVWCSKMSGGIQRDWVGVPRMLYTPGSDSYRCACINLDDAPNQQSGNLKEYPDCNPKSTSCYIQQ